MNCPHCGRAISITLSRASTSTTGGGWAAMGRLESSVSTPWGGPSTDPARPDFTGEYYRSEPSRPASWEADVLVNAGQAIVSSLIVGACGVGLNAWLHGPWFAPLLGMGVSAALVWFLTLSDSRSLLRRVERITNTDLDGDQVVGAPEPERHEYVFTEKKPDGAISMSMTYDLGDISPERLQTFAKAILAGQSTKTSNWTGAAGLFSRAQYDRLRDKLIQRDLARWCSSKNKATGWALTKRGADLFQSIAGGNSAT